MEARIQIVTDDSFQCIETNNACKYEAGLIDPVIVTLNTYDRDLEYL